MKLPTTSLRVAALCAGLGALTSTGHGQSPRTFSSQFSFGDSLSDNGNLYAFTSGTQPPAPYYNGRFSNGPVFVELLQPGLQPVATAAPTTRTNLNFAFGGATATAGSPVPSLAQQLGLMQQRGITPAANDLFTVLAGANDLLNTIANPATQTPAAVGATATAAAASVSTAVQSLLGAGARNILVMNLPDIARTARFTTGSAAPAAPLARAGSQAFNAEINSRLAALSVPGGARVTLFDVGAFFDYALATAPALAFPTTNQEYLGQLIAGQNPGNPAGYFFWDGIHPTTGVHRVLASALTEALNPELVLGASAPQGGALLTLAATNVETIEQQLDLGRQDPARGRVNTWYNYTFKSGTRDPLAAAGGGGWEPAFDFDLDTHAVGLGGTVAGPFSAGLAVTSSLLKSRMAGLGGFRARGETFSLYATWQGAAWNVDLTLAKGAHDLAGIRRVTALGGMETSGHTDSSLRSASLRVEHPFPALGLSPWAALRTARVDLDGYTESGVPSLNFQYAAAGARSTDAALGVKWRRALAIIPVNAGLQAALQTTLSDDRRHLQGTLAHTVAPAAALQVVDGNGQGVTLGGQLDGTLARRWSWGAAYALEMRDDHETAQRFSLSLRTRF